VFNFIINFVPVDETNCADYTLRTNEVKIKVWCGLSRLGKDILIITNNQDSFHQCSFEGGQEARNKEMIF